MDVPWTIATAVISASSALIGVYVSNRSQEKRLKIQFENDAKVRSIELKKAKLEDMFILFQKWEMDISTLYLRFIPVLKGEYSATDARRDSTENSLQERGDHQKFQAILNLYFPEHKDAFNKVMKVRGEVLSYCHEYIEVSPRNLDNFYEAQNKFELETASFRALLAQAANEL